MNIKKKLEEFNLKLEEVFKKAETSLNEHEINDLIEDSLEIDKALRSFTENLINLGGKSPHVTGIINQFLEPAAKDVAAIRKDLKRFKESVSMDPTKLVH